MTELDAQDCFDEGYKNHGISHFTSDMSHLAILEPSVGDRLFVLHTLH